MPMFKLQNSYYPMAREVIKKIYALKKAHVSRSKIYNQIGFLTTCKKENIIPTGLKVKDKVLSTYSIKKRQQLERTLITEQRSILFAKMNSD